MAKIIILLIFLVAFQLSSVVSFTGISFCEEKYFDNMFQDKQFIYLNVFDAQHSENRLYRWVYGSSQIDQFVTANVDSQFLIPQSGVYMSRYDATMRTYYQPKESFNKYATFCIRYGPKMRLTYNSTDPFPLYPLCNCSHLKPYTMESFTCDGRYTADLLPERLLKYENGDQFVFPFILPEDGSLNNKYRSLYFQNINVSRNIPDRLFTFKRHKDRELSVTENMLLRHKYRNGTRHSFFSPLDIEVVGLVSVYDDTGNITVSYLLEEVAIDEITYVVQYFWEVNVFNTNYTLMPNNRKHWREFFGCHYNTALPIFTFLGLLLYTILVVVAIILSVMYFYFDYDLLLMKAKQTTLSYYFS